MRLIIFTFLLTLGFSCSNTKNAPMKSRKLNGAWIPVKQEIGGVMLPNAAFKNQRLIINDSAYTVIAESADKAVVRYEADKMDIYGKEGVNSGKHFKAIYKFEKNQLIICYNLAGDNYPETFETKGKPTYFLSVFKKERTK